MKSIRSRLLLLLMAGLAIVLILGGTAVYWIAGNSLLQQFDAGLSTRAHTIASLVKREPGQLVFETGDAPAETINETYFQLNTHTGEVLKLSDNLNGISILKSKPSIITVVCFELIS